MPSGDVAVTSENWPGQLNAFCHIRVLLAGRPRFSQSTVVAGGILIEIDDVTGAAINRQIACPLEVRFGRQPTTS